MSAYRGGAVHRLCDDGPTCTDPRHLEVRGQGGCNVILRGGFVCQLDADHKGRHTSVAFWCDSCQKYRRGTPARIECDGNGDPDVSLCWFCLNVTIPRGAYS